jgi:hypothetical protein
VYPAGGVWLIWQGRLVSLLFLRELRISSLVSLGK